MARRSAPEINAGSMADIAFLLLIFFLVTTTVVKDKGLIRQLPPIQPENVEPPKLKERNTFIVQTNQANDLLVEDTRMEIGDLKEAAIAFLDNGGAKPGTEDHCNYCEGNHLTESSDNPKKAVIIVQNHRESDYETFIKVQNELVSAYNFLRNRESQKQFGWKFTEVKASIDEGTFKGNESKTKEQLQTIQKMWPMILSEAEPKKQG